MRAQMTIVDLDEDRWNYLQRNVRAEYEIPDGATRLCLTFSRGDEERHVEMPLGVIIGLLVGLGMTRTFKAFTKAVEQVKKAEAAETENLEPWPTGESEETQANQRAADMEIEDYEAELTNTQPAPYGFGPDGSVVALDQDGNP